MCSEEVMLFHQWQRPRMLDDINKHEENNTLKDTSRYGTC